MIALLKCLISDLMRYNETYALRGQPADLGKIAVESIVFKPGFQSVLLFRIAHCLYEKHFTNVAWFINRINQGVTSAEIEFNADISPGLLIPHPAGIVIGRGSKIGENVTIYHNVTLGTKNLNTIEYPTIGDNVIIFSGAKVLGGIRVGNNVVIGANSVVTKNVPEGSLVIGSDVYADKGMEIINELHECITQRTSKC